MGSLSRSIEAWLGYSIGPRQQYVLLKKLEAPFVSCFLVKDQNTNENCVLRLMGQAPPGEGAGGSWVQRERLRLLTLQHDGLPFFRDLFIQTVPEHGEIVCLVEEHIDGMTARQKARSLGGTLPLSECLYILEHSLQILDYLHARVEPGTKTPSPVLHLDIKPNNLRFRNDGQQLLLVGLGLSRRGQYTNAESQVVTPDALGYTPGYAPYEQTQGRVSKASDLYSLAMTVLVLHSGLKSIEIREELDCGQFFKTHKFPRAAKSLLRRMLAVSPQDRIQSAKEALDELQTLTRGKARRKTQSIPKQRDFEQPYPRRRSRGTQQLSVALLVVVLLVLGWRLGDLAGMFKAKAPSPTLSQKKTSQTLAKKTAQSPEPVAKTVVQRRTRKRRFKRTKRYRSRRKSCRKGTRRRCWRPCLRRTRKGVCRKRSRWRRCRCVVDRRPPVVAKKSLALKPKPRIRKPKPRLQKPTPPRRIRKVVAQVPQKVAAKPRPAARKPKVRKPQPRKKPAKLLVRTKEPFWRTPSAGTGWPTDSRKELSKQPSVPAVQPQQPKPQAKPAPQKPRVRPVQKRKPKRSRPRVLTSDNFLQIIQKRRGLFKYCYERELKRKPGLQGTLKLRLTISTRGRINRALIVKNSLNQNVASCVVSYLVRNRYPKPREEVTVFIPFFFSPST